VVVVVVVVGVSKNYVLIPCAGRRAAVSVGVVISAVAGVVMVVGVIVMMMVVVVVLLLVGIPKSEKMFSQKFLVICFIIICKCQISLFIWMVSWEWIAVD